MNEVYIISDIHLGTNQPYDWFKPEAHAENLIALLEEIAGHQAPQSVDLVIAGDLFEAWLAPPHIPERTIGQIMAEPTNQPVFEALKDCIANCNAVYYINGNHDMFVQPADLRDLQKEGKSLQFVDQYAENGIYITHGHQFALFNAKDYINHPTDGLPLGYYMSRIAAGQDDSIGPATIANLLSQMWSAWKGEQSFTEAIVDAYTKTWGMDQSQRFIMADGSEGPSIAEINLQYANLYDQWAEKYGDEYAGRAFLAEMGSLGWFADRTSEMDGCPIVVMGHTHDDELDKDTFMVKDRIYANSGSWVTETPSYVRIENRPKGYQVNLYQWVAPTKVYERKIKELKKKGFLRRILPEFLFF